MTAYADIADLPNHIIPPIERRTSKTTFTEVALLLLALGLIAGVALGVWTFGLVALGLTAVVAVPVVMVTIIMITLG